MNKRIVLSVLCCSALVGCESTKGTIGLNKQVPDEFQVVKRAPLALPPDYVLRPPRPGAPRPQEQETSDAAAESVFGQASDATQSTASTSGESALLSHAGSNVADPNIRQKVDHETKILFDRNKPVAEKIFGIGGDKNEASATVVDAKAEAERLQENAKTGQPVTAGETPSIEE